MNKQIIKVLAIIFIMILCVSCQNKKQVIKEEEKINVAVSIVPQKEFIEAIAGDYVDVVAVIPPGYSPANYMPNTKQMEKLSNALIYFSIGVPTEKNVIPKIKDFNKDIEVVKILDQINKTYENRYFDEEKKSVDPHVWMSPKRTIEIVDIITEKLKQLDVDRASIYQKNADNYKEKLEQLDEFIKEKLLPYKNKAFMIYHPSLGYLADDYNLTMIPIEKQGKKSSLKQLEETINQAKKLGIHTIFYQEEFDGTQADIISQEIKGKCQKIDILSQEYIKNLKNIVELLCDSFN